MKQEPGKVTDDLLVKYLLNEADGAERTEVQHWIAAAPANKKHFEHFALIWNESKKLEAKSTIDENAAWERFKQKIEQQQPAGKTIPLRKPAFNWLRVAAMLLLMVGGGWAFYYYGIGGNNRMVALNSGNTILTQTLPDGTLVTLNKNSSIRYPRKFSGDSREVELKGEAFFNVTPDKQHPFIITANDASIRVVGTSFNVKSSEEKTEVIVETGIVEVSKQQQGVRLQPKQKATVFRNRDQPLKEEVSDELYNYYRTREFICNGTPLYRLVDVLNEVYNADIVIEDERLRQLPLTTTFHDESLDGILDVISKTFNIRVEKQGSRVVLKP